MATKRKNISTDKSQEEFDTAPLMSSPPHKREVLLAAAKESKKLEKQQILLIDQQDRWKKWWTRFNTTVAMIAGFVAIIYIGHFALIAFVIFLQAYGFKEILNIRHVKLELDKISKHTYWGRYYAALDVLLFFSVIYMALGFLVFERFGEFFYDHPILRPIAIHHMLISFGLLTFGVVVFVFTLKKGFYRTQFQQLAWSLSCLICVVPSCLHYSNIFEGLIWFLLPVSMIVCNDIAAFVWGFFFGRTPLIGLSPKKTWEGFLGAFFTTVVFGFILSWVLAQMPFFICPKVEIFANPRECVPQPAFVLTEYAIPVSVQNIIAMIGLDWKTVTLYPIQLHSLVLSTFGSFLAPFGGFAASGFKRAFNIKDFGDLFPGHGGLIDRMDCQLLMSVFAFVYHRSFVEHLPSVGAALATIYYLPASEQLIVFNKLKDTLAAKGLL